MRLRLTLAQLWFALAAALPALAGVIAELTSVDLAYHLRAGESILAGGPIPRTDSFTFTAAGQPWLDQQWAAEVIMAGAYRLAGWTGLVLLRAGLIGATFGLLAWAIHRQNRALPARQAALLVLGAFVVATTAMGLRPQLFAMPLFALVLALIADRHAHPGRLWIVPVVVAVWANLHGTFFFGPVLLILAWLEDLYNGGPLRSQTLGVALVAVLAATLNPFGLEVWGYAAGLSTNRVILDRVTEWQPTTIRSTVGVLFFSSLALVGLFLARRRSPAPWPALLTLGLFAALGLFAVRGLAWWPPVAVVVIAGLMPPVRPSTPSQVAALNRPRTLNSLMLASIALVAVLLLPFWRPLDAGLGAPRGLISNAPSGITAALRDLAAPGDRLWNPQLWGSWFEFAVPNLPVSTDARFELFEVSVWEDDDVVAAARASWPAVLDRWAVTIVVVAQDHPTLAAALGADQGWRRVFMDADGSIFVRANRAEGQG